MSVIEEAVFQRLSSSTDVLSVVPKVRIRPSHLPQDPTMPSITYHRISTQRVSAFKDDTGDAVARFQVSSWDDSYSGVKGAAQKVQAAMQRWASSTGVVTIQDTFLDAEHDLPFEPQTQTYHVAQDYLVWFKE